MADEPAATTDAFHRARRCEWRDSTGLRCIRETHDSQAGEGHVLQFLGDDGDHSVEALEYRRELVNRLQARVYALEDERAVLCERIAARFDAEIIADSGLGKKYVKANKQWDHAMRYAALIVRDFGQGICNACEMTVGQPCCNEHAALMCDRCYRANHVAAR